MQVVSAFEAVELSWVRRYNEVNHARFEPGHEGRPFAYFVQTGGRFLYASTIRLMVLKALVSLSVSEALHAIDCLQTFHSPEP
jgi:ubiquinol-cytochrome c reductase iron-sulfur subunit